METQTRQFSGDSDSGGQGNTMTEQVKAQAQQVVEHTQEAAGQVAEQAKHQAGTILSNQKGQAVQSLGSVSGALRHTGETLEQQDQKTLGQVSLKAADSIDRISGYLEQHEISELVTDVEGAARRSPALFLGGAFTLGLLAARFLKSSKPQSPSTGGNYRSAYGNQYEGGRSSGYGGGYDHYNRFPGSYETQAEYSYQTTPREANFGGGSYRHSGSEYADMGSAAGIGGERAGTGVTSNETLTDNVE